MSTATMLGASWALIGAGAITAYYDTGPSAAMVRQVKNGAKLAGLAGVLWLAFR